MAELVVVAGVCDVMVNVGEANALIGLGRSINGVEITEETLVFNVPGDQNGGDDGLPIEIQEMGEHHFIRIDMSIWDPAVAGNSVFAKYKGNTAGVTGVPGIPMFGTGGFFTLKIVSAITPSESNGFTGFSRIYPKAFPVTRPVVTNLGTKYSHLITEWECQPPDGGGALWTAS